MSTHVNGDDVARFFGRSGNAQRRLNRWKNLPGCGYVAEKVLAHKSMAIFEVAPETIQNMVTEHPLGDLRETYGNTIEVIRDWRPDFAFSHLFHFCAEDLGRIYSWEEFRDEWSSTPAHRPWLHEPAWEVRRLAESYLVTNAGYGRKRAETAARNALRWRLGTAYYSFLREVYSLGCLRRLGLPVLSHPLADALFRTDLWCGTTTIEIYIDNPRYRSGNKGRKHHAEDILSDQRRFNFVTLQMAEPSRYGSVELPTTAEINRCAEDIRNVSAVPGRHSTS
jgi:hypothetical protein